jgi:hypothetical protein
VWLILPRYKYDDLQVWVISGICGSLGNLEEEVVVESGGVCERGELRI